MRFKHGRIVLFPPFRFIAEPGFTKDFRLQDELDKFRHPLSLHGQLAGLVGNNAGFLLLRFPESIRGRTQFPAAGSQDLFQLGGLQRCDLANV